MKLIDTNIFIYAVGRLHPLKGPCISALSKIIEAPGKFNIDVEVLQEVMHIYHSRGETQKGVELVNDLLILFPNPFPISKHELATAISFITRYPNISARDALHAAVVAEHSLAGIVSTDTDFDRITECPRISPGQLQANIDPARS